MIDLHIFLVLLSAHLYKNHEHSISIRTNAKPILPNSKLHFCLLQNSLPLSGKRDDVLRLCTAAFYIIGWVNGAQIQPTESNWYGKAFSEFYKG